MSVAHQLWRGICVLALVLLVHGTAWACSCAEPRPEEWRTKAVLVFRGRVVATNRVVLPRPPSVLLMKSEEVRFRVLERFKGPKNSQYVVFNGPCNISQPEGECFNTCEAPTVVGREYVVFAFAEEDERPVISLCGTYDTKRNAARADRSLRLLRLRHAVEQ